MLAPVRDEGGFGLVEAVVAGGLLLVAIIGGISVFDSSRRESATGERQEIAALQAQAEVERLRDLDYAGLAIDPDPSQQWQASGGPGDPTNRVEGTTAPTFRVAANQTEEMVFASTQGEGVDGQARLELAMGDSTLGVDVYRFVSWRDEECPVTELGGITGPLGDLTDETSDLVGAILSPSGLLNALLGPLFGILNPIVGDRLGDAEALLENVEGELPALIAAVGAIEQIDPCDADVETLNAANETLEPLAPLLTELDSRINAYHAGCTKVLGVIVSCPGTGSSLYTNLNQAITNVESEDLPSSLSALVSGLNELELADHTHNTKRVTVAVVLDPRTGSGPTKPVWATSVVSDPDEGLLAGP